MFEIDVCYKFIFESMLEDDVLGYIANKVYEYTHAGIFFVSESGEILAYACSGKRPEHAFDYRRACNIGRLSLFF